MALRSECQSARMLKIKNGALHEVLKPSNSSSLEQLVLKGSIAYNYGYLCHKLSAIIEM